MFRVIGRIVQVYDSSFKDVVNVIIHDGFIAKLSVVGFDMIELDEKLKSMGGEFDVKRKAFPNYLPSGDELDEETY